MTIKIGILSDSHNKIDYTKDAINLLKLQDAEFLVHAGDLCSEENLKLLKNSQITYVCVFGNNDYSLTHIANNYNIYKEPYYFKIKQNRFQLMHLPFYMSGDSDIVIYGHTHIFESSYNNGTLFINPGEICAREKPQSECVLLEIKENEYIINYFNKNLESTAKDLTWNKKIIRYIK